MTEPADPVGGAAHSRTWRHRSMLGIGEAMVEFATLGGDTYRRGFAGDTLNTCWTMARLLGDQAKVGYCTKVGVDGFSDDLIAFIRSSGMDTRHIARDAKRHLGLYVIGLTGVERRFTYWREQSAARGLADELASLTEAARDQGLVHVSGITLAVIGEAGRSNLVHALARARRAGTVVSFDPNVRMRLWRDPEELRAATRAMLEVVDIALPSFDDEALAWGDTEPDATLTRLEQAGVGEIVVKNGAGDAVFSVAGHRGRSPTPEVAAIRDTTGAGDAFNAGYLSARWVGQDPRTACAFGQRVAGEVIGHFGALAPEPALAAARAWLNARKAAS